MNKIKDIYKDFIYTIPLEQINWEVVEIKDDVYCNNIISFDVETTSLFWNGVSERWETYIEDNKGDYLEYNGIVYCWSAAIGHYAIQGYVVEEYFGRTLESFNYFLEQIEQCVPDTHKYIYVHNLKFEFQFLRNLSDDWEIFARDVRTPIYATLNNFEFRCSYILTNLSLENWAKTKNLPHQKLVGQLDYLKERTPYTYMSRDEIDYSIIDSVIVVWGIKQYLDTYSTIKNIPLTQTGTVRRELQSKMLKEYKWHDKMSQAHFKDISAFQEQKKCFWGGLTRANRIHANRVVDYLASRDATSAYPWHMLSKQFPVSDFIKTHDYSAIMNNRNFCYYLTVEFYNIKSKFWNSYIPLDKCESTKGVLADNGRIIEADYVRITCLDIDFNIICSSYTQRNSNHLDYEILDMHYALLGYLNNNFRRYIVQLFNDKTVYKDVEGMEEIYQRSKEKLNSLYGMMVTNDFNNEISYKDGDWHVDKINLAIFENILNDKLKKKYKLNYVYAMGCYVTAYQRKSLWDFVKKFDDNLVYMDTDSHKYYRTAETEEWYEEYNENVRRQQQIIAEQLGIPLSYLRPTSPSGKVSSIGEYMVEHDYLHFKTLGAKRYAYQYEGDEEVSVTISGVNKKTGGLALKGNINNFTDGFIFPYEYCKKLSLHYCDSQQDVVYCKGNDDEYVSHYRYGICAEPSTYTVDLHEYKNLLKEMLRKGKTINYDRLERLRLEYEKDKKK